MGQNAKELSIFRVRKKNPEVIQFKLPHLPGPGGCTSTRRQSDHGTAQHASTATNWTDQACGLCWQVPAMSPGSPSCFASKHHLSFISGRSGITYLTRARKKEYCLSRFHLR
ncbi:hypothetical protein KL907_001040 [Ogataea polymorpha]|nr:hypothetical protein KL907_001040 [Ogataea polymorpha]